jgi:hypothetical protein
MVIFYILKDDQFITIKKKDDSLIVANIESKNKISHLRPKFTSFGTKSCHFYGKK